MSGQLWAVLAANLGVVLALATAAFVPSRRTGDPSYVDGLWGLGFLVVAAASLAQTQGPFGRRAVLVVLTCVWGLRLAGYLLLRWRRQGPDPRYQLMLAGPRRLQNLTILVKVFWLQAALVVVVALPVEVGLALPGRFTWFNLLGALVAITGITVEATADRQLSQFKRDLSRSGQVLATGLWRYSRHPNYVGEALTWWGLFGVCLTSRESVVGVLGPVLLTVLLVRVSGIGPAERHMLATKPGYAEYVATTPAFLPIRPRARRVAARS